MVKQLIPLFEIAVRRRGTAFHDAFVRDVAALRGRLPWRSGSRVLVAGSDAYAVAVAMFGALHGGCAVLFPANLQPSHLRDLLTAADGMISAGGLAAGVGATALPAVTENPPQGLPDLQPLDPGAAEVVLNTSGTTGEPLAVAKALRQLDAEVAALEQAFGESMGGDVIATAPPYHIYGLLFRVLWPLAAGRSFDTATVAFPEEIGRYAARMPSVALVSTPAFLRRALPLLDLATLRDWLGPVFSSGGPLPPDVAAAYNAALQHPVAEVYGSTETGGIGFRVVRDAVHPPAWTPLPGVEVSIDAEDGVLSVRSLFLSGSEWFRTADLAVAWDGGFDLRGRSDRVVKLQEQRISLVEVERRLSDCPTVDEARVVTVMTGAGARESLGAVVRPSEEGWDYLARHGRKAFTDALAATLRPYLHGSAIPRRWRFVTCMPTDDRGKTTMAHLLSLFAPDGGRRTAPEVLGRQALERRIRLQLRLPEDLFYFDGHFPQVPVLPGVVQIDWAMRFAEENFGPLPRISRIEALKFFEVLTSNREVALTLAYDAAGRSLSFSYDAGETRHSSGRVALGDAS